MAWPCRVPDAQMFLPELRSAVGRHGSGWRLAHAAISISSSAAHLGVAEAKTPVPVIQAKPLGYDFLVWNTEVAMPLPVQPLFRYKCGNHVGPDKTCSKRNWNRP